MAEPAAARPVVYVGTKDEHRADQRQEDGEHCAAERCKKGARPIGGDATRVRVESRLNHKKHDAEFADESECRLAGHDVETRGAEQHPGEDLAEERRGAQRAREHALEEEHGEHEREHAGLRGERDHGSRCRRVHPHGLGTQTEFLWGTMAHSPIIRDLSVGVDVCSATVKYYIFVLAARP